MRLSGYVEQTGTFMTDDSSVARALEQIADELDVHVGTLSETLQEVQRILSGQEWSLNPPRDTFVVLTVMHESLKAALFWAGQYVDLFERQREERSL